MPSESNTVRIIRVFVSSPGDVQKERAVMDEVVASINRTDGQTSGFRLELFRWEDDVTPQIGPKPQKVVDQQTPVYDIYVGIMSTRFGTPTGRYGSGTEKEFKDALKKWKKAGAPWIAFYFNAKPDLSAEPDEVLHYAEVCKFRKSLEKQGIIATYAGVRGSEKGFFEKVSEHLRKIVRQYLEARKPWGAADDIPAIPSVPSEYTEWLLGRCGEVELMGLEIKHGSGVRLNHVYTPLATSARPEETKRGKRRPDEDVMPGEQESKQLLLALLDKQSLYVSGDPGSGKSTFCRWVTWLTCNGEMPEVDVPAPGKYHETFPAQLRDRLPVLVRLRDFWQYLSSGGIHSAATGSLEHALELWLADQKYPVMDWPCLQGHLEHGSALLMLDGVDEVPPVAKADGDEWYPRQLLVTGLSEAVARWTKAGSRVLVASRPYGLDSQQQRSLGLPEAPILGLDSELQALLVRRWFIRLKEGRDLGMATAEAMIDHLHVESGLDDLTVNPLLLTAMCIVYDEGKRLPHDKYVLYDRIVDTVLHKRYPAKERTEPIRGRLAAVALGMHTGEGLGQERMAPEASASDAEIDLLLQAYQQLDGSTDKGLSDTVRVREDLLSQSGLLVSRGDGGTSFYHLSIQEFLAAERLFLLRGREQDGFVDVLLTQGMVPGWRNTLSLLFGCLVAKFSPHMGAKWLQDVVQRIPLPTKDQSPEQVEDGVWKQAIVVGDCLQVLAGRGVAVPDDLGGFLQRTVFQAIDRETAVEDRHTLAVALGHLGDPRITADLRLPPHPDDHLGYVKIPADKYKIGDNDKSKYLRWALKPTDEKTIEMANPFWLSKYPVTNSQFALFVDERGYFQQNWWWDEGWQWIQNENIKAPLYWRDPDFNSPNQPVVGVSWWEADAYCRWARGSLPTEQQLEVAARGPEGLVYPWGNDWEDGICNSREAGLHRTSAVDIFPRARSRPLGLGDMAGNVWCWCCDPIDTDGRVFRGGSWHDGSEFCRSAFRGRGSLSYRIYDIGFRVAADLPEGQPSSSK